MNIFLLHYLDTSSSLKAQLYFLPHSEGIVFYIYIYIYLFQTLAFFLFGGYFVSGFVVVFIYTEYEGCLPLLPFLTMSSPFVVNNSHVLGSLWIPVSMRYFPAFYYSAKTYLTPAIMWNTAGDVAAHYFLKCSPMLTKDH